MCSRSGAGRKHCAARPQTGRDPSATPEDDQIEDRIGQPDPDWPDWHAEYMI
ncbi:MAG: hypothetical protein ACR2MP_10275 [Streptosporangiaceae bacterium]